MKIVGFVEGARVDSGGVGLIGVPLIHSSLCQRGHRSVLAIGGRVISSGQPFVHPNAGSILQIPGGALRVVTYAAVGRWCFGPDLISKLKPHVRDADFISLHSLYSFPVLAGDLLARRHRKPYGIWPHGVLAPIQRTIHWRRKWVYDRLVARRILNQSRVVIYTSPGERKETQPLNLRSPSVVIPHGINVGEYAMLPPRGGFRTRYLGGHAGPLVLYLGRLNAKKGLDLLIQAMAEVIGFAPTARLAIVGGGHPPSFADRVHAWIRDAGLETRAVLTGVLTDIDKLAALADADVFALPSLAENFGFAMFEAMASRLPVVITDALDYADQVRCTEAGFSVRRDPHDLAAAILTLLGNSELRRRMGENGLRLAQEYSWEACGEKVERMIECVVEGKPFPAELDPA